ncbi:MAG TPA: type II toxin-antitoxin system PemK/MazF family toxin [Anaerolineae bacterium]|nr:type II toxin-antitoxin system PemK/MazF family toxin [Anaerolineae bacterium]
MARADVFWVNIPYPKGAAGREQAGWRPAIAVQSNSSSNLPTVIIVPATTKMSALRFPHTIEVKPSKTNGFNQTSVLLVFQLRAIDKNRIVRKIGRLEPAYMEKLEKEIKNLLELD